MMKRFIFLLLPVFFLSCKSTPEKINADLKSLRADAERNDAKAQWELGDTYMKLGNWSEANQWLQKAAERGVTEAQYQLAQNYEKGQGIRKDFIEAYAWFFVAAEHGHLMALNGRERLSRLLSHADLEAANRKAFEYATKVPGRKETQTPSSKEPTAAEKKTKVSAPKVKE
jgi:TPR repeat protein